MDNVQMLATMRQNLEKEHHMKVLHATRGGNWDKEEGQQLCHSAIKRWSFMKACRDRRVRLLIENHELRMKMEVWHAAHGGTLIMPPEFDGLEDIFVLAPS